MAITLGGGARSGSDADDDKHEAGSKGGGARLGDAIGRESSGGGGTR